MLPVELSQRYCPMLCWLPRFFVPYVHPVLPHHASTSPTSNAPKIKAPPKTCLLSVEPSMGGLNLPCKALALKPARRASTRLHLRTKLPRLFMPFMIVYSHIKFTQRVSPNGLKSTHKARLKSRLRHHRPRPLSPPWHRDRSCQWARAWEYQRAWKTQN